MIKRSYLLPEIGTIESIQAIINDIFLDKQDIIEIDWLNCNTIHDDWICTYLNLQAEARLKGVQMQHINQDKSEAHAIISKVLSFPANEPVQHDFSLGFYITSVKEEQEIVMRSESMKSYLRMQPQLQVLDLSMVETLFSELYMNVCQHAGHENGFVYVTAINDNGEIGVYISDLGIGIPEKIRTYYHDKASESDADCIRYATDDLVTTKSTSQNYGRGLNTLKTSVLKLKGKAEIRSSRGVYKIGKQELCDELYYDHRGTLISISLNFSNFDAKPDSNYTEEIDF